MTSEEQKILEAALRWAHQIRANIRRSPESDYANDPHSLRIPKACDLYDELLRLCWAYEDADQ